MLKAAAACCCLQASERTCWLVSEIMTGGTLAHWLHADKGPLGPNKTLLQRVQKALDVGVRWGPTRVTDGLQQLCLLPHICSVTMSIRADLHLHSSPCTLRTIINRHM